MLECLCCDLLSTSEFEGVCGDWHHFDLVCASCKDACCQYPQPVYVRNADCLSFPLPLCSCTAYWKG